MSGHTPGPWLASGDERVVSETLLYCGAVEPVVADGNGYRGDIATLQSCNHLGRHAIGREEAAANARLIAAAPELLEALFNCLPYVADSCMDRHLDAYDKARGIIAKATGEAA